VFFLNLLFGWTFVGWLLALVMAKRKGRSPLKAAQARFAKKIHA
jgi:hypothetical protein